ncbi:MAG: dynamin family protein [Lentisphaerae bacterium]|nr:dynamin family protein [Lentisphaerota bacterium]
MSTLSEVRKRIHLFETRLRRVTELGNPRLTQLCERHGAIVDRIRDDCQNPKPPSISLIGTTGAGKSSLLNALLGERILPVSSMRACTAAIAEVRHSDTGTYRAEVEFISRESWLKEIDALLEDIRDAERDRGANREGDTESSLAIPKSARDKIMAVYDPDGTGTIYIDDLVEPPEIKQALDAGSVTIEEKELGPFRAGVKRYLASDQRFWPLVKRVCISGPFAALRSGVMLIDLPGVNDPNEAREAVTHGYIKSCLYMWIVFNVKRGPTRDLTDLMQRDDFIRQVVMDGRAATLTFVGTATDDIDIDAAIEEFGLPEDAQYLDVIQKRNVLAKKQVRNTLDDLSRSMAGNATVDHNALHRLSNVLQRSPIFTVSAHEFMRINGISRTHREVLTEAGDTEIPALCDHMTDICREYTLEARLLTHHAQMNVVEEDWVNAITAEIETLRHQAEIKARVRAEVERALKDARTFLESEVKSACDVFREDLSGHADLLGERLRHAVERGQNELGSVISRWGHLHWATLKATTRRGGRFIGATGTNDFSSDIAKPVLDSLTFAWADFFGDKLTLSLEKHQMKLLQRAESYRGKVLDLVRQHFKASEPFVEVIDRVVKSTEKVFQERLKQTRDALTQRIEESRRTLYEQIVGQIDANMRPVFIAVSSESGTGMKQRMLGTLGSKARNVSGTMFDDSRKRILEGVRSLCDWMGREFSDMGANVLKNSEVVSEHLLSGGEELSDTEVQTRLRQYEELLGDSGAPKTPMAPKGDVGDDNTGGGGFLDRLIHRRPKISRS